MKKRASQIEAAVAADPVMASLQGIQALLSRVEATVGAQGTTTSDNIANLNTKFDDFEKRAAENHTNFKALH